MPHLAHLCIYPIKSLDGVFVDRATLLPSGALQGDREFAIVDQAGKFVNGKRTAQIHLLRSSFDLTTRVLSLGVEGSVERTKFHLDDDRLQLAIWLSDYFGFPVQLIQDIETGFPDDLNAPGPTVISTATLTAVASWFPELSLEQVRSRFRSNLEIEGVPAFWEDCLFSDSGEPIPFTVAEVQLLGINPCQRCVVITRDPQTSATYPSFQKTFVAQRQATLPEWAAASRFNHFYRLAVNTRVAAWSEGTIVQIGSPVECS
ncbi:MAG: MOSC domain-containing protein [Leptolyngbyaceae cyanobacterium CRU_2_3]|nr:MOSC domain-containing protein [Leptolyngbyaceae cyanobacterium CRU_2_3]